jgi:hypothetical protein
MGYCIWLLLWVPLLLLLVCLLLHLLLLLLLWLLPLVKDLQHTLRVQHHHCFMDRWPSHKAEYVWGLLQDLSEGFGASKALQAAVEELVDITS